ncbi:IS66 family transposase, partial [Escherichia coli]
MQGWCGGTLVSDGYSVYKSLADNDPGITSACCWSHARRGFANLYKASREPRAAMALNRPGFPGECFICELRLPDHRFRWKH